MLAAVFPAAYEMHRTDYERHVIAWFIGGVFAGLAVLLAVHQILQHLIYYRQPRLQKVRDPSIVNHPESQDDCSLAHLRRSMSSESSPWYRSMQQTHGSDCGTNQSLCI